MVTRLLLPTAALVALLTGCGGGDDAEAMQAALAPEGAAVPEAPAPAAPASDSAAVPAAPADPLAPKVAGAAEAGSATEATALSRESFSYTGGSRDPFASLLATSRVGPELPDLSLVAIYYDTRTPSNSVVVMREKVSGKRYSLRPGDRIGRIRLSGVRPKDALFTIDDFGTERQVTVSLRKQEDTP